MASSKLMPSSKPRNSDPSSRASSSSTSPRAFTKTTANANYSLPPTPVTTTGAATNAMTVDGALRDAYATRATSSSPPPHPSPGLEANRKTVDEVWREIVSGRKELKEEERDDDNDPNDEMMTLEDFLARAGAVDENDAVNEGKVMVMSGGFGGGVYGSGGFDQQQDMNSFRVLEGGIVGYGTGAEGCVGVSGGGGGGRAKRGRGAIGAAAVGVLEPFDKAAVQRQRRMIKNRESAARSRERKQVLFP